MSIMTPAKVAAVLAFLVSSCGGATDDLASGVGSNTNWLTPCLDGSSCGEGLSCLCGVCTTTCSEKACPGSAACVDFTSDACSSPSEPVCLALCSSHAGCVDVLGPGFSCVSGRCEASLATDGKDTGSISAGRTDGSSSESGAGNTTTEPASEVRIVEIGSLTNSPPPAECVQGLPPLLPGCDPNALVYSGIDCDADGVPDYRLWRCEVATAERPPEFTGSYDCAPEDPGLRYWVTPDADGDGFGDGRSFCAGPTIPEGYVLADGVSLIDCADESAAAHPGALEIWGDGVDSDCREGDGPSCDLLSSDGETYLRSSERPSNCMGQEADLFLSPVVHCGERCPSSGAFYFFVGNAGTAEAPGPIVVSWSDDTGAFGSVQVSSGALAPGGTTAPFAVPTERSTHTEVAIDFADCDLENGRFVADMPSGNQTCL